MAASPKRKSRIDGTEYYRFKIDAYTPATMPMARLAQYMNELAILLGERDSVHFRGLTKGSTVLNARVDREAAPKVHQRVVAVRAGDASREALRAFNALNALLSADNAVGVLRDAALHGAVVIRFHGRELAPEKFTVRQQGSIDGIVTGVRGKDETIHVTLQSEGRQISGCETTRPIAKQLGAKLFEPVRLFGRGRWIRDADGVWTLEYFRIESFEPLQDVPLTDALAALRDIPTNWGDDSYAELMEMRTGPGSRKNGGH
ncbi:hypothetical protein [Bradyrhizobium sp. STM 3809]|uniref:hypothetical protein n=1 Tax=Bradyrhizobium sp. STM 3809 TaxID=551936 RepID=UPI0002409266|nr:hypothetical protein [Bradyrhizobium sp. STM 3809]CCE00668.1 conserved hypothetical protein [Bradyrhizobium sp. STM 3809]